jgi:hypothetical protein
MGAFVGPGVFSVALAEFAVVCMVIAVLGAWVFNRKHGYQWAALAGILPFSFFLFWSLTAGIGMSLIGLVSSLSGAWAFKRKQDYSWAAVAGLLLPMVIVVFFMVMAFIAWLWK